MKFKYEKTHLDKAREISDIRRNPIMRFLKNQEHFKFNLGDVLIKQRRLTFNSEWETEVIPGVNTPKKFMYVFENDLGIGYVKQLRVDGKGFTTALVCTANFDPDHVKFQLDPDFVDHMLIGEEEFEYNKEYVNKKAFREEATKKNTKILIRSRTVKTRTEWLSKLKIGDIFWVGLDLDEMTKCKYEVTVGVNDSNPLEIQVKCLESSKSDNIGKTWNLNEHWFTNMKITNQQPFPMEDPLCDRPR